MRIISRPIRRIQADLMKQKIRNRRGGMKRRVRLLQLWSKRGPRRPSQTAVRITIRGHGYAVRHRGNSPGREKKLFCVPGKRVRYATAGEISFHHGR